MDPIVIVAVVGSAVLHVTWNVRLKTAGDPLVVATIGLVVGSAVVVPLGIVAWWAAGSRSLPWEGVMLGVASGVVEAGYFALLAAAYRRGDLSVVYPIARGAAPLLLVVVGVVLLGERLGAAGWAGVAMLVAGLMVLQRPWLAVRHALAGAGSRPDAAIAFAVATGVAIATYTTIDRIGTRLIDPVPYAAILWPVGAVLLVLSLGVAGGPGALRPARDLARSAAVVGVLTVGSYLLVLYALSVAPLTAVAPLRESATVVAATWGAVRLREAVDRRDTARRIGASGVIVLGSVLLALDGG